MRQGLNIFWTHTLKYLSVLTIGQVQACLHSSMHAGDSLYMQWIDESSKLLTFNTLCRRYRFTSLPFGFAPALEIYPREVDKPFEGVPLALIVDDFLIHGKDQNEVGLKLKPGKFKL